MIGVYEGGLYSRSAMGVCEGVCIGSCDRGL